MNIIKISKLKKTYKDLVAIHSLDLEIKQGDVHGILGPNGAGKSTLISCIVGLTDFDSGVIEYEGNRKAKSWSRHIGYVPQELSIYPELSAYENIKFFGSLYGLKGEELEGKTKESLEFVGLLDVKDKRSSEFSGGMKRRLNLACAITHSPKIIIMDEPTVGIDPQSRNRILENVRQLNMQGVTIIYTTHYMEEVEAICNKITVIDKGNVVANGSKEQIKELLGTEIVYILSVGIEERNWTKFIEKTRTLEHIVSVEEVTDTQDEMNRKSCLIRCKNEDVINSIFSSAMEVEITIKNITHKEPSLEEIFLELTGKGMRD